MLEGATQCQEVRLMLDEIGITVVCHGQLLMLLLLLVGSWESGC